MSEETKQIDDGGPAFPRRLPDVMVPPDEAIEIVKAHSGMTLRDYFAAQAMQATVAGCPGRASDNTADISYSTVAIDAYKFADAMLKARAAR